MDRSCWVRDPPVCWEERDEAADGGCKSLAPSSLSVQLGRLWASLRAPGWVVPVTSSELTEPSWLCHPHGGEVEARTNWGSKTELEKKIQACKASPKTSMLGRLESPFYIPEAIGYFWSPNTASQWGTETLWCSLWVLLIFSLKSAVSWNGTVVRFFTPSSELFVTPKKEEIPQLKAWVSSRPEEESQGLLWLFSLGDALADQLCPAWCFQAAWSVMLNC